MITQASRSSSLSLSSLKKYVGTSSLWLFPSQLNSLSLSLSGKETCMFFGAPNIAMIFICEIEFAEHLYECLSNKKQRTASRVLVRPLSRPSFIMETPTIVAGRCVEQHSQYSMRCSRELYFFRLFLICCATSRNTILNFLVFFNLFKWDFRTELIW